MEFTRNATDGKFTVFLDGTLYNNCTTDADCPGRAMCGKNITWAAYPDMCVCLFYVGVGGSSCNGGCASFVGCYNIVRLVRIQKFKTDALTTSLIFATIALIADSVFCGATSRYPFEYLPVNAQGNKVANNYTGTVAIAFTFVFSTLAMLNVSLVWIKVATHAGKMQKSNDQNILRYRNGLIVYYLVFCGVMIAGLVVGNFIIVALAGVPGILFVIISYIVGFFKMNRMLSTYLSDSASGGMGSVAANITGKESTVHKFRESLRLIRRTTLGTAFFATAFIVFFGIWVGLGGFNVTPQDANLSVAGLALGWMCAPCAVSIVLWYLHETIQKKERAIHSSANSPENITDSMNPRFDHTRAGGDQSFNAVAVPARSSNLEMTVSNARRSSWSTAQ